VFRGTPNWMAPESVKKLEYTRFSDIWAIGCLVIEMVTGEPPWSNYKNPMAVLFQLYNNNNPPPLPDKISETCKDFINCCLKIEPNKRLNVRKLLEHPFITGNTKNMPTSFNSSDATTKRFNVNILDKLKIGQSNIINDSSKNNTGDSYKLKKSKNFFNQSPSDVSHYVTNTNITCFESNSPNPTLLQNSRNGCNSNNSNNSNNSELQVEK